MANGTTTRMQVGAVPVDDAAEREAWLAWMVSTDRHHPDCYIDAQQEELFSAWKAARSYGVTEAPAPKPWQFIVGPIMQLATCYARAYHAWNSGTDEVGDNALFVACEKARKELHEAVCNAVIPAGVPAVAPTQPREGWNWLRNRTTGEMFVAWFWRDETQQGWLWTALYPEAGAFGNPWSEFPENRESDALGPVAPPAGVALPAPTRQQLDAAMRSRYYSTKDAAGRRVTLITIEDALDVAMQHLAGVTEARSETFGEHTPMRPKGDKC